MKIEKYVIIDEVADNCIGPSFESDAEARVWLTDNQAPGSGEYSIYKRIGTYKIEEKIELVEIQED